MIKVATSKSIIELGNPFHFMSHNVLRTGLSRTYPKVVNDEVIETSYSDLNEGDLIVESFNTRVNGHLKLNEYINDLSDSSYWKCQKLDIDLKLFENQIRDVEYINGPSEEDNINKLFDIELMRWNEDVDVPEFKSTFNIKYDVLVKED
jgi:hypothetical protein